MQIVVRHKLEALHVCRAHPRSAAVGLMPLELDCIGISVGGSSSSSSSSRRGGAPIHPLHPAVVLDREGACHVSAAVVGARAFERADHRAEQQLVLWVRAKDQRAAHLQYSPRRRFNPAAVSEQITALSAGPLDGECVCLRGARAADERAALGEEERF